MVGNFEIWKEMASRNMDIRLSLTDNLRGMKSVHKGKDTDITIGFPGNVIQDVLSAKLVGGFLLYNQEQYFAIKKELEEREKSNG